MPTCINTDESVEKSLSESKLGQDNNTRKRKQLAIPKKEKKRKLHGEEVHIHTYSLYWYKHLSKHVMLSVHELDHRGLYCNVSLFRRKLGLLRGLYQEKQTKQE